MAEVQQVVTDVLGSSGDAAVLDYIVSCLQVCSVVSVVVERGVTVIECKLTPLVFFRMMTLSGKRRTTSLALCW